jgi:hypothetical protein
MPECEAQFLEDCVEIMRRVEQTRPRLLELRDRVAENAAQRRGILLDQLDAIQAGGLDAVENLARRVEALCEEARRLVDEMAAINEHVFTSHPRLH